MHDPAPSYDPYEDNDDDSVQTTPPTAASWHGSIDTICAVVALIAIIFGLLQCNRDSYRHEEAMQASKAAAKP